MNIQFDKKLNELIQQKYEKYKARIVKHLKKSENKYLIDYIISVTPKLDNFYTLGTRIYWVLNGLTDFPKCKNCGKPLEKINVCIKTGYTRQYCGYKCLNTSEEKMYKVKQTCLKKYGVENPYASKEIQQKIKQTCLKRYGADSFNKTTQGKELYKKKSLLKYGTEFPFQSEIVKNKIKTTVLQKYGVENIFQSDFCKNKIKNVLLEKYNADHPMHVKEICKKVFDSRHKKFLDHISFKNNFVEFLGYVDGFYTWKCKKCGNVFKQSHVFHNFYLENNHIYGRCEKCYPINTVISTKEMYIFNELRNSLKNLKIEKNNRDIISPKELDIYIPEKKLAIEFDGLYWHSSATIQNNNELKNAHLNKTLECLKQNIQLIHIFEDEFEYKRDIVLSRLNVLCGNAIKIYARKCNLEEVSYKEAELFLHQNHIQGSIPSKINLALKNNNDIID